MIRLYPIGLNQNVVALPGMDIFFSYKTPVAAFISGRGFVRTDKFYSRTTSRHINKWLSNFEAEAEIVAQEELDSLLDLIYYLPKKRKHARI